MAKKSLGWLEQSLWLSRSSNPEFWRKIAPSDLDWSEAGEFLEGRLAEIEDLLQSAGADPIQLEKWFSRGRREQAQFFLEAAKHALDARDLAGLGWAMFHLGSCYRESLAGISAEVGDKARRRSSAEHGRKGPRRKREIFAERDRKLVELAEKIAREHPRLANTRIFERTAETYNSDLRKNEKRIKATIVARVVTSGRLNALRASSPTK